MTDPFNALQSFQSENLHAEVQLERGVLDKNLYVYEDWPNGVPRITYVRLDDKTVTAFVNFGPTVPVHGTPCFGIGYAVPEVYRNQGRAKEAVTAAIAELQYKFGQEGHALFFVDAIVAANNKPSQRVAEQCISSTPEAMTDGISGLPALRYVRKLELPT